jgi:DNA-binding HxlR family transcriptional regulator
MKVRKSTACPIAFSLDVFGDAWSLIVLRDVLFAGKSHFREFLTSKEKIASNILSARLEKLVSEGLLVRQNDPTNKSAIIYKPTNKALDLLPVLYSLMSWGAVYNPNIDKTTPVMKEFLHNPKRLHTRILNQF